MSGLWDSGQDRELSPIGFLSGGKEAGTQATWVRNPGPCPAVDRATLANGWPAVASEITNPSCGTYAALRSDVRTWTVELTPRRIGVNVVSPGPTETPMTANVSDKFRTAILGRVPVGRVARPEEIAEAALFLASDGSAHRAGSDLSSTGRRPATREGWKQDAGPGRDATERSTNLPRPQSRDRPRTSSSRRYPAQRSSCSAPSRNR